MAASSNARASTLAARLRVLFVVILGLVYVASWPGSTLRAPPAALELVAPVIPKEISLRDGVLDVIVHTTDGEPQPAADDDSTSSPKSDKPTLAGARVRAFAILEGRAHSAGEAITDQTGRATLKDLPQAEHWIVAEAEGRARASRMVVVVAGARRLDLELGPEHSLDVLVKDEQGEALSSAELEVRGPDPFPVGARTGADGRAHVGRLGAGPYTVVARAVGFEEVTKRRAPAEELCVITLGKQGALLVEVTLEDGTPAPSARVLIASPSSLGSAARVTETDREGKVRISGLERGSYALRAVSGTRVSAIDLGVVLGKGEQKPIHLTLAEGRMISAHVVDGATDDDVRDARVSLVEGGLSPFPLDGVTDKKGRVTLGPISRGAATLAARAEGFVPKAALALDEETAASEVRVPLSRGGTIVGKIRDGRGYSVDGATVRVIGTDLDGMPIEEDPSRWAFREAHFAAQLRGPTPLIPAGELGVMPGAVPPIPHAESMPAAGLSWSNAAPAPAAAEPWVSSHDGTYRATPVTPGRVRVVVQHPQYVEAMSDTVLLESSKELVVDVVLKRGGMLEGRVVDSRTRPVPNAHVTALATNGSLERSARTGTDGSFAFAALPDAITILVARDEDPTSIVARVEATIPEAGKKSIEITLPEPRPALPVKVIDKRRDGVEQAQVSAVSLEASAALRVTSFTDARGRAELVGAKGLALRVEVRAPGHAAKVIDVSADASELVVELAPAESITGEVIGRRRDAIVNAEVTLQTEAGVRHGRTDKDGIFVIADVPKGPALLRVRAAGRAPDARNVLVEEREGRRPTDLGRIELAEEGIVEGTVVDGRGDPIPGVRVAKDAVPTYLPVGAAVPGMAVTDGRGRFKLGELAQGILTLEAYAADVGRARRADVNVSSGRTTSDVKIVIQRSAAEAMKEPMATGGVAVTLGETVPGLTAAEVIIVAVVPGSEAERGGLAVNDIVLEVGGVAVEDVVAARRRLSGPVHDDVLVKVRRGERVIVLRVAREAVRR